MYIHSLHLSHITSHIHTHMTLIYLTHPALSAVPKNKRYMLHYATLIHVMIITERWRTEQANTEATAATSAKPTSTSISLLFPFPSVQRRRKYDEHGTGSGCWSQRRHRRRRRQQPHTHNTHIIAPFIDCFSLLTFCARLMCLCVCVPRRQTYICIHVDSVCELCCVKITHQLHTFEGRSWTYTKYTASYQQEETREKKTVVSVVWR